MDEGPSRRGALAPDVKRLGYGYMIWYMWGRLNVGGERIGQKQDFGLNKLVLWLDMTAEHEERERDAYHAEYVRPLQWTYELMEHYT